MGEGTSAFLHDAERLLGQWPLTLAVRVEEADGLVNVQLRVVNSVGVQCGGPFLLRVHIGTSETSPVSGVQTVTMVKGSLADIANPGQCFGVLTADDAATVFNVAATGLRFLRAVVLGPFESHILPGSPNLNADAPPPPPPPPPGVPAGWLFDKAANSGHALLTW